MIGKEVIPEKVSCENSIDSNPIGDTPRRLNVYELAVELGVCQNVEPNKRSDAIMDYINAFASALRSDDEDGLSRAARFFELKLKTLKNGDK